MLECAVAKLRVEPRIGMIMRMRLLEPAPKYPIRQSLNIPVQCHMHTWTQSLARGRQAMPATNRSDHPSHGGNQLRTWLAATKRHPNMAPLLTLHLAAFSSRRHMVLRLRRRINKALTCSNLLPCSHRLLNTSTALLHLRLQCRSVVPSKASMHMHQVRQDLHSKRSLSTVQLLQHLTRQHHSNAAALITQRIHKLTLDDTPCSSHRCHHHRNHSLGSSNKHNRATRCQHSSRATSNHKQPRHNSPAIHIHPRWTCTITADQHHNSQCKLRAGRMDPSHPSLTDRLICHLYRQAQPCCQVISSKPHLPAQPRPRTHTLVHLNHLWTQTNVHMVTSLARDTKISRLDKVPGQARAQAITAWCPTHLCLLLMTMIQAASLIPTL